MAAARAPIACSINNHDVCPRGLSSSAHRKDKMKLPEFNKLPDFKEDIRKKELLNLS